MLLPCRRCSCLLAPTQPTTEERPTTNDRRRTNDHRSFGVQGTDTSASAWSSSVGPRPPSPHRTSRAFRSGRSPPFVVAVPRVELARQLAGAKG